METLQKVSRILVFVERISNWWPLASLSYSERNLW